jgi:hypothetical protein
MTKDPVASELNFANDPSTDPSSLAILAEEGDVLVRLAVARNPSTSTATLMGMLADTCSSVREAAASHTKMLAGMTEKPVPAPATNPAAVRET